MKKYEQMIVDSVRMPPRDASCEMKEGAGFNIGYERGHGQAKADARAVARQADAEIEILKGVRDCYNELIMEVQNKVEGVSRHERALRIIRGAEALSGLADKACYETTIVHKED